MQSSFWLKYKSGTDIRFTAIDSKDSRADITKETVQIIVAAFVVWLGRVRGRNNLKIAIGYDPRISSKWLKEACLKALAESGCDIFDCGLCSTPSMFQMTKHKQTLVDGSIMITASHHPYDKNGLKFFTPDGGLESCDIDEILRLAKEKTVKKCDGGSYSKDNYMKLYTDSLISHIQKETGERKPLKGFKIVVDAGNGAGGFFVHDVLKPLGADTTGSQFLSPDGMFPNHIPNPEDKIAMKSISDCVILNHADLGIIFDTDVDRAAVVDSTGKEINRNRLIALMSAIVADEYKDATIVTDSVTSDGLAMFITNLGCHHLRYKRGYKNVIDKAIKLTRDGIIAPLAIETSGHAALAENYYLDDGAYLTVKILIKMYQLKKQGKDLFSLIKDLQEPIEECEVRLTYAPHLKEWKKSGEEALQLLEKKCSEIGNLIVAGDSYEGVRVSCDDGFFLLRQSVHDPVIPVNFEASRCGGVARMKKALLELLQDNNDLVVDKLK